ncbi:hypothetical protein L9F63_024570, partial [Diploptera punctata]
FIGSRFRVPKKFEIYFISQLVHLNHLENYNALNDYYHFLEINLAEKTIYILIEMRLLTAGSETVGER